MNPYIRKFHCKFCVLDFDVEIPFGCFVDIQVGSRVEIIQERVGRVDSFHASIFCHICGCSSGLDLIKPNVAITPTERDISCAKILDAALSAECTKNN